MLGNGHSGTICRQVIRGFDDSDLAFGLNAMAAVSLACSKSADSKNEAVTALIPYHEGVNPGGPDWMTQRCPTVFVFTPR